MAKNVENRRFYVFDSYRIDVAKRLLLRDEEPVPLKPKAFETLLMLVQNSGRVVEKDELMRVLWPDTFVEEANLTQHISLVRRALGDSAQERRYIVTVPGRGYCFVGDVKEVLNNDRQGLQEAHTASPALIGKEEGETVSSGHQDHSSLPLVITPLTTKPWNLSGKALIVGFLLVMLTSAIYYLWRTGKSAQTETNPPIRSIAVLPFKPLNLEADNEYLGIGLADALITKLSNFEQLTVRPTSTVLKYANTSQDPQAAGSALKVDAALSGHIQKTGDGVRVTVQLLSVRDGKSLWAATFDEQWTNIFKLQDSVAEQVAKSVALTITDGQAQLTKHHTDNPEAYQLYIKARYHWSRRMPKDVEKAIEYFKQAIATDPSFALAHAGLADCLAVAQGYQGESHYSLTLKAKDAALKALELDQRLAEPHATLGWIKFRHDWDYAGAEREFRRAIELKPGYTTARHWYGFYLAAMGRFDEAIAELKRAQEQDPVSLITNTALGTVLLLARRYDQAIVQYHRTLELDPYFTPALQSLGWAYAHQGKYEEAIHYCKKAVSIDGGSVHLLGFLGYVYAVAGQRDDALKTLATLKGIMDKYPSLPPFPMALIYTGLGDRDEAFKWLEKTYAERDWWLCLIKVNPVFDDLRSDPRFDDLLRRVKLAP